MAGRTARRAAAGVPPDVEVDLDDAGARAAAPAPVPAGGVRGRAGRAGCAAAGLAVGLLLGHAWFPATAPDATPAPSAGPASPPVRVAFAARGTGAVHQVRRVGRLLHVPVPAVVVNETSAPLVVRDLRVSGPGAGLGTQEFGMFGGLPMHLPPGEAVDLPFTLTSDCAVPVRPLPRITLVVGPDDGSAGRPVDVRIPDLGSVWGRTLDPGLCRD